MYLHSMSIGPRAKPPRLCIMEALMLSGNSSRPHVLGGIGEQGELRLPKRNGISISSNIFIFVALRIAAEVNGYETDEPISRYEGGGPKVLGRPAPMPPTPEPKPYREAVPAKPLPRPVKPDVPSNVPVSKPKVGWVNEAPKGGTPAPAPVPLRPRAE